MPVQAQDGEPIAYGETIINSLDDENFERAYTFEGPADDVIVADARRNTAAGWARRQRGRNLAGRHQRLYPGLGQRSGFRLPL